MSTWHRKLTKLRREDVQPDVDEYLAQEAQKHGEEKQEKVRCEMTAAHSHGLCIAQREWTPRTSAHLARADVPSAAMFSVVACATKNNLEYESK